MKDAAGQPVPGVTVAFAVTAGGGLVSTTSALSDSLGQASTALTLGPLEGTNTVVATAQGVASSVAFGEVARLAPALHADYYVNATLAGASDSNDGLSATMGGGSHGPWKTVGKAATVATAGDVVHVAAGTYAENVVFSNIGSSAAPVRFYAAPGATIGSMKLRAAQFLELRGFNVVGSKTYPSNWVDMPQVVIDDPTVGYIDPSMSWTGGRQALVARKFATYLAVVDSFNGPNYSAFTAGIWLIGASNVVIANNTVSLHTIGIDCDGASTQLTITNNSVHHCRNGIWSYASSGSSFTSSTIFGNTCRQNLYSGITVSAAAQSVTVEGNLCEYNAIHQFEVSSNAASCTLRRNVAQYAGYYTETMQWPGSSAYNFYAVGPGNVADSNYAAYQLDATLNDGNGFIVDTSSNGVKLVNNVCYRNEGSGISFTGTTGNSAINNTLVENGYQSPTTGANGAGIRAMAASNTIVNNIFSGNRGCNLFTAGLLSSQTVVDWNLYAPGVAAIRDSWGSSPIYATVTDVRAATGREAHGLTADPGFVGAASANFRITSTSAAVGVGDGSRAPLTDYAGVPRTSPPDLGAFQH